MAGTSRRSTRPFETPPPVHGHAPYQADPGYRDDEPPPLPAIRTQAIRDFVSKAAELEAMCADEFVSRANPKLADPVVGEAMAPEERLECVAGVAKATLGFMRRNAEAGLAAEFWNDQDVVIRTREQAEQESLHRQGA